MFDPIEEPRGPRRAANDDRETIGQILQAIQKGQPCPQRLHACLRVWRRLGGRLRPADRQLPARAAGGDRTERRRAGARRPCGVVLCAGAVVLFPRQPRLARPGNADDRAVDGAGRDPLLRARGRRRRFDGDRRASDPPRSRRDGRRRRARDRARRRTGNARRQRSRSARARLYRQRGAHSRAAAGHRPSARQSGRPGRAGSQRHFRRPDRPAPRHRADLGRDRLARRRSREKHHRRAGRARPAHHRARSAMPATT